MKLLALFSAGIFLASTSLAHAADSKSDQQYMIKVDCCKSSGCFVANRSKFHKKKFRGKVFSQKSEAEKYLRKLSLSLKEQNPRITTK